MKKVLISMLAIIATIAFITIFSFTGCKTTTSETTSAGTTAVETTVAETTSAETTSAETTVAETTNNTTKIGKYSIKYAPGKNVSDLNIAVVYLNMTIPAAAIYKLGVDKVVKETGVNAYMTGPDVWDTAAQYKVVEDLITKGVDGIAVAILDIPGMTPIIQKALEAGIPVVCWNVDAPASGRFSFTGQDLVFCGAESAKALISYMGEKGNVIISSVAATADFVLKREMGARQVLYQYPNIHIIGTIEAPGDEETSYAATENAFLAYSKNPGIDGIIDLGGTQRLWARLFKEKGIGNINSSKPIYSVGQDVSFEEPLIQIKEGWATVSYGQHMVDQPYFAVKQLIEFLKTGDEGVFETQYTETWKVDKSNVDQVLKDVQAGNVIG